MPDKPTITLLALETSCDETGVAVVRGRPAEPASELEVLSSAVASQMDIHVVTGGVVPEVAAREHVAVLGPMVQQVMTDAGVQGSDLTAVAVTVGPGLMPALVTGVQAARSLAYGWSLPLVPAHHMEGHIYSALLPARGTSLQRFVVPTTDVFPAVALLVSGGHTLLIAMHDHGRYDVLGQTRDDAAGEAFDKVARLLELPYPGGPHLSALATQGKATAFSFARPMLTSGDLNFSFSGLKTDVLYTLRDLQQSGTPYERADIAASFEQAVVDVLVAKTSQAIRQVRPPVVLLAGGVAANERLRMRLAREIDAHEGVELRVAPLPLCGDNAVMIGLAGLWGYEAGRTRPWREVDAIPRVSLDAFFQHGA